MPMIMIRNAFGGGQWGGQTLGSRWIPAISGAINQTGLSDEEASTVGPDDDTDEMVALVASQLPRGRVMSSSEDGYDGYEISVR